MLNISAHLFIRAAMMTTCVHIHALIGGTECVDEFEKAGLESVPSDFIRAERVKGARASIECTLRDIIRMGDGYMVFGDVVCFHIDDEVWVNGRVDIPRLQPVGKLDGLNYSTITEIERLELPADIARMTKDYGGTR